MGSAARLETAAPEQRVLQSSAIGRLLLEEARALILVVRQNGSIVEANPAAQIAYDYALTELQSMSIFDLCDPDDLGEIVTRLQSAGTDVRPFTARHRRRDGTPLSVEVTARGLELDGERHVVCLMRDAAEREREARDRELAAIVTTSDDAIIGKRLDGTVTSWNRAAERLYGWTAAEMVGQSITRIVPDDRLAELADILARLGRGVAVEHHDTIRVARDGRRIEVSLSVSPIKDARGTIVGAAKIARDVTERRRLERQQREFLLLAAHELRTPLTALQVSSQLLKRRGAYDEQLVTWILNRVQHLSHLIEGLVDSARFESGPPLRTEEVDLTALARDVAAAAQSRTQRHTLHLDVAGPVVGWWDRSRIEQVLDDLLDNAIAYAPGGQVVVLVEQRGTDARIVVTDEGPGVPADLIPALFDRFVRLAAPGLNPVPGLGLGLFLCRTLVEAHGGQIWVENAPGGGAMFIVELPIARPTSAVT